MLLKQSFPSKFTLKIEVLWKAAEVDGSPPRLPPTCAARDVSYLSVSKLLYPINVPNQIRLVSSPKEWTVHDRHSRYVAHTRRLSRTRAHRYTCSAPTPSDTVKDILLGCGCDTLALASLIVPRVVVCKVYIFSQPMASLIFYLTLPR